MRSPTPEEIRAARKRAGLTQTQAAHLIGFTLRAWQDWEGGARNMHAILWCAFQLRAGLITLDEFLAA